MFEIALPNAIGKKNIPIATPPKIAQNHEQSSDFIIVAVTIVEKIQ